MQWIQLLALALAILVSGVVPLPADAASKYKACSLLTASEVEATLQAKVTNTDERDITISEGTYKGDIMSTCTWVVGSAYVSLNVIRGPRTPEERATGLAIFRKAEEDLKNKGWKVEGVNIAGVACSNLKPPASEATARPIAACAMESKGLAFSVTVIGSASPTAQQAKALADKVVARLP